MHHNFYKLKGLFFGDWIGFIIVCVSIGALSSCSSTDEACNDKLDLSKIQVNVEVEDLSPQLLNLKTPEQAKAFLIKHPDFAKKFAPSPRFTPKSAIGQLLRFSEEPYMTDSLYAQIKAVFGDYSQLKQEFTDAFKHIKYYYPSFKVPKIKIAMTGLGSFFGRDLYLDDEVIFISPDYFAGKNARFKPREPYYIQRRYAPKFIVPVIVQAISRNYNKIDIADKTLVADMVTRGKELQFVKTMLPCTPDSLITGFTARQMANVNDLDNRKVIWSHFVQTQILFDRTVRKKKAYMGERPYTAEVGVGKECPGKIGWWVGWQIVRKYMKKFPKKTIQEVMAFDKNIQIFNGAAYKGE